MTAFGIERKLPGGIFIEIDEVTDVSTYVDSSVPVGSVDYRIREKSPFSAYSNTETVTTASAYQPSSQAYFDRNVGLSTLEKNIIDAWVVRYTTDDNLDKLDEFFFFGQVDGDYRIGFKTKTGVLNGGATQDGLGIAFGGTTGYFDTGFNLSTDGINYVSGDGLVGGFIKTDLDTGNKTLVGGRTSASARTTINTSGSDTLTYSINSTASNVGTGVTFDNNTHLLHRRYKATSNGIQIYKDGVQVSTDRGNGESSIPSINLWFGAENNNEALLSPMEGTISCGIISGGIGFDPVAANEADRIMIASFIDRSVVTTLAAANIIIDAA
jgi:hypothetical protein